MLNDDIGGTDLGGLVTTISELTNEGAIVGFEVKEDGVYVNYISGADTVSKKLGEGNFTMQVNYHMNCITGSNVSKGVYYFASIFTYNNGTFTLPGRVSSNIQSAIESGGKVIHITFDSATITFD